MAFHGLNELLLFCTCLQICQAVEGINPEEEAMLACRQTWAEIAHLIEVVLALPGAEIEFSRLWLRLEADSSCWREYQRSPTAPSYHVGASGVSQMMAKDFVPAGAFFHSKGGDMSTSSHVYLSDIDFALPKPVLITSKATPFFASPPDLEHETKIIRINIITIITRETKGFLKCICHLPAFIVIVLVLRYTLIRTGTIIIMTAPAFLLQRLFH